jgi:hypothetical protein
MVAVALVAYACGVVQYVAIGGEPMLRLAGIFAVPLFLGAAIGTLAGRPWAWVRFSAMFDLAMAVLILIWLMVGATGR